MRDALIALLIFYAVVQAFRRPWTGAVSWVVISILNPHRLSWRAATWPVAAVVGGITLFGLLYAPKKWRALKEAAVVILFMFLLWMIATTFLSASLREPNVEYLVRVLKIVGMIFVSIVLIQTRQQIVAIVIALVVSLAFYGVKGGVFTIATGGSYRVWGPDGTFIAGNNELALALIMTIPLIYFLRTLVQRTWLRHALSISMLLMVASAIGSQSRGALLAICAMSAVLWLRSKRKLASGVVIAVVAAGLLMFMPESWFDRMHTIQTYDQDASAMGRINAWHMAFRVALAYPFGGGFEIHTVPLFRLLAPIQTHVQGAHSIYFQVLGEHGFVGLALFLSLWFAVWRHAAWLRREGAKSPETEWVANLGAMCQVSLVGYLIGGAFLALAYFDLPYDILAVVVVTKRWMLDRALQPQVAQAEAPSRALGHASGKGYA